MWKPDASDPLQLELQLSKSAGTAAGPLLQSSEHSQPLKHLPGPPSKLQLKLQELIKHEQNERHGQSNKRTLDQHGETLNSRLSTEIKKSETKRRSLIRAQIR